LSIANRGYVLVHGDIVMHGGGTARRSWPERETGEPRTDHGRYRERQRWTSW